MFPNWSVTYIICCWLGERDLEFSFKQVFKSIYYIVLVHAKYWKSKTMISESKFSIPSKLKKNLFIHFWTTRKKYLVAEVIRISRYNCIKFSFNVLWGNSLISRFIPIFFFNNINEFQFWLKIFLNIPQYNLFKFFEIFVPLKECHGTIQTTELHKSKVHFRLGTCRMDVDTNGRYIGQQLYIIYCYGSGHRWVGRHTTGGRTITNYNLLLCYHIICGA